MAKLNNVKVLDMVGGEITRISYDGVEYTKVDSGVSANDILMPINDGWDFTGNSFYRIVEVNDRDNPKIYDDKGDRQVILYNGDEKSLIFRKVTATTPPIEERVSALESRVDAIESGKATEDEQFAPGDVVRGTFSGDLYTLKERDYATDDFGYGKAWKLVGGGWLGEKQFVKANDEVTPVDEPLKVGDYARVICSSNPEYIGKIVELVGPAYKIGYNFEVVPIVDGPHPNPRGRYISRFDQLVRATDEEVAKAKAEFKRKQITVGTYVKLAIKDGQYPRFSYGSVSNGDIGKVSKIGGYGNVELSIDFESQSGWNALFSEVEIATAEEYEKFQAELTEKQAKEAERKKWAAIGREVGEYKEGDVIKALDTTFTGLVVGHLAIVTTVDRDGDVFTDVKNKFGSEAFYVRRDITLVTPVEQRFDLPEVTA